jgi:hypothetical protein
MTKEKAAHMGHAIRVTNLKLLTQCMICHPDRAQRSGGICSFTLERKKAVGKSSGNHRQPLAGVDLKIEHGGHDR